MPHKSKFMPRRKPYMKPQPSARTGTAPKVNTREAYKKDGYTHIRDLETAEGAYNSGIALVRSLEPDGPRLTICKNVISSKEASDEAKLHLKITQALHPHIVQLYKAFRLSCDQACIDYGCWNGLCDRLYMEYCDKGSLMELVQCYHESSTQIPEAFIWVVLESVLKALCYLHRGAEHGKTAPKDWDPIVHCDVRPANILLSSSRASQLSWSDRSYSTYPRVVLADFGQATPKAKFSEHNQYCMNNVFHKEWPLEVHDVMMLVNVACYLCIQEWDVQLWDRVLRGTEGHDEWRYSEQLRSLLKLNYVTEKSWTPPTADALLDEVMRLKAEVWRNLQKTALKLKS